MSKVTPFVIHDVAAIFQDLGFKGRVALDEGYSLIESASSGDEFIAYCYSAANSVLVNLEERVTFIRFRCCWFKLVDQSETELDSLCNWFNANYPFSKLFREPTNHDPFLALEAEVVIYDGMTAEALQGSIRVFIHHLDVVRKSIERCRKISKADIHERHNRAIQLLHGEDKNIDEAVRLYRHNAHLGYAGSQNNFGDLFEKGMGVPQDLLFATYWYARAAERNEPTAFLSLAQVFCNATDNVDALIIAAMYATLGADRLPEGTNRRSAESIRDELRGKLEPGLFQLAEELARDYCPLYKERATMSDTPGPMITKATPSSLLN